jgi:hypothetical protein
LEECAAPIFRLEEGGSMLLSHHHIPNDSYFELLLRQNEQSLWLQNIVTDKMGKGLESSLSWDVMLCSPLKLNHISRAVLATCFMLFSCLAYSSALKMEVTCSSELLVEF